MAKTFKTISRLSLFMLATFTSQVAISEGSFEGANYIGFDALYSYMKLHKDYGGNIFAKSAPGINVFFGHMYNNNLGFEVGYEVEKSKKKLENILANNIVLGHNVLAIDEFELYETKIKRKQPYLGVVTKAQIKNNNYLQLLLGYSLVNVRAKSLLLADGNGMLNIPSSYAKTKAIPMVRAAFEHKFSDQISLRAFVDYRNTNQIKITLQEQSALAEEIRCKDAIGVGVGIAYYIN